MYLMLSQKSCRGSTQVWDAGPQAGGWAGIEHQLTLCPVHVPGLSPCRAGALLMGCAGLLLVGWCFTHSMSLGTAGPGEDIGIGISGMMCAHEGMGGLLPSYCAVVPGHKGCRKLRVNPQYSDKLLWEKSLTCTVLPLCPGFLYSYIIHGGIYTWYIYYTMITNDHQIGVLRFRFPSLLKLVKDVAEPVWRGPW